MSTEDGWLGSRDKHVFSRYECFWEPGGGGVQRECCGTSGACQGDPDAVTLSFGEGSCRVITSAIFQLGPVHGMCPSYSCVNVDSGLIWKFVRAGIVQIFAVVGMLAIPCGMRWGKICWEKQLLTHVGAGRPGLFFLLPTTASDAGDSVPGSALSIHPHPGWPGGWSEGARWAQEQYGGLCQGWDAGIY